MSKREWNTPLREPWNPLIYQCLKAIDRHMAAYLATGNTWHAIKAQELRRYVAELKDWIFLQEDR
jgi:hypothetical protein